MSGGSKKNINLVIFAVTLLLMNHQKYFVRICKLPKFTYQGRKIEQLTLRCFAVYATIKGQSTKINELPNLSLLAFWSISRVMKIKFLPVSLNSLFVLILITGTLFLVFKDIFQVQWTVTWHSLIERVTMRSMAV